RHVQVGPDRRESDADHRDVEGVEEERGAEHQERGPAAPAEGSCRVGHGRRIHAHAISAQASCASTCNASYNRAMAENTERLVEAWRQLSGAHAAVFDALERELPDRHGLTVSEFEVLQRLAEAPERHSR